MPTTSPAPDPFTVVDLVLADLQQASIPAAAAETWLYTEPEMIEADQQPLLSIWPKDIVHTLEATPSMYQDTFTLTVDWFQPLLEDEEAGEVNTQADVRSAGVNHWGLVNRMRDYADGSVLTAAARLLGYTSGVDATLVSSTFEASRGGGWRGVTELTVRVYP
jgi:hypothetical protein